MHINSVSFGLLLADTQCWDCHRSTRTAAVWVPEFRFRHEPDEEEEYETDPALLTYIEKVSDDAFRAIQARAPWLGMSSTRASGMTYLVNHCTHCGKVQGDNYLHKPGAPFFPLDDGDVVHLTFVPIDTPMVATCATGQSRWMREVSKCVRN